VTLDSVAVCATRPDVAAILDALLAAGPQLGLQPVPRSGEVQLLDEAGRVLVSIDGPILVQVAGEAQRLLGVQSAPNPSWWVTCRADGMLPGADGAAERLCAELVRAAGGLTWPR